MKRKARLTREQEAALASFAHAYGRTWKAHLGEAWERGNYSSVAGNKYLQQVRLYYGPSWLVGYKLPKEELP